MKKLILITSAFLAVSFFIWDSDTVQRKYSPKNYWARQVERLDRDVRHFRYEVNRISADLLATPSAFLRLKNEALERGMSPEAAGKNAEVVINVTIRSLNEDLNANRKALMQYENLLERAKSELKKYERR